MSALNRSTSSVYNDGVDQAGNSDLAPIPPTVQINSEAQDDYDSDDSLIAPVVKEKSRKPADNAFRQQRLAAFNPVLTAKTVIPLLIAIAVIFVPLGAAMWYASHVVQDIMIDYSQCENEAVTTHWSEIPATYTTFNYKNNPSVNPAQWKLSTDESQQFADERRVCQIQFNVATEMKAPIYLFYRLHNFYANHRRYVKSYSEDQLTGLAASADSIKTTVGQNCEPMSLDSNGKRIYPCGLIANSLFNDTYSSLTSVNGSGTDYDLTEEGIAWGTNDQRFKKTQYHYTDIVPPPNWYKQFPNGYNSTNVPDISTWAQFQNWMKAAGLPNFNKLALRNDQDHLQPGTYQIEVGLHFPVLPYKGKKFVYISQRSVIGGKNVFLGISWIVGGGICFLLAISLLIVNLIKPRKTGDVNLLSWNKENTGANDVLLEKGV